MIRIFKTGHHANRTPLSYAALAPLFADHIQLVDSPAKADLYLFSHSMDVETAPRLLIDDWRRRRRPVVILSEEPFWDTIWGGRPLDPLIRIETPQGALPVHQLNHCTTDIYHFARIPYYLLTAPRFVESYAGHFRRNAALGASDWRAAFADYARNLTFMFERRPERYHSVEWSEADLSGLCAWRTDLAEACDWESVNRLGQSWQGGQTRFDLKDWHGDKLRQLDRSTQLMGALENTHHPDYITEKIFDAFAIGARPVYYASPGHRVHEFGLPPESWINLHGQSPAEAAETLRAARFGDAFFDAFHDAQVRLAALFTDPALIEAERTRLRTAVLEELQRILESN
ncbi:glycosyltransferase family 10 domain-containing protein [Thalassovita aquimarina]|uniref:Fucosyltransferase C-terminal domain-containing protein n=1 Tax=Thalassovita aquimarina TaxID=2785917 RepID=A0ABS5HM87_9RHOB|nr:glycosyltransferase family 10 [Thalassovita aquimarina]MBR9650079.1 hypothetical protein [Thalassovita aquimarina]